MSHLRIAVILGSTRPGRNGKAVADWVIEQAAGREATYDLVDLADVDLPLLDEAIPPSMGEYQHEHTKKWAATVAQYDGFVFVTPEYNRSTSGALKNAIDFLYGEWNDKAAAFVGYGSLGGARAVEHLRGMSGELQLADVRQQLSFSLMTDFKDFSEFTPGDHHGPLAASMFDQLERWAGALKTLRS
ncbi:FMN reductase [Pseudoclavibacter endophyticus]|uniref:NAD(P)H-dependent oxidoreductase n=1 Tax=Pseudoclavibacter endophyticus TaxID=1778590 RepID=A0A6H9WGX9_9MICO|nr:NAD(P)H-dependent oxidoreductase [Pseudoclavibacter endophyticus]KAB1648284.1 NAD(P)H-dependent oxidoreductase [Pseudoclavibacter endophyticus]GGA71323.1 FMN reductase [Pseudoclavibacter endophyticus]